MADGNSSKPIPDRWQLVIKSRKDGSNFSYYLCQETGQQFHKYEDLMRYVNYAGKAKVSIYSSSFTSCKPKKKVEIPGPSSEMSAIQGATSLSTAGESSSWNQEECELQEVFDCLPPLENIELLSFEEEQKKK